MIAYNLEKLNSYLINQESLRWCKSGVITNAQFQAIDKSHPIEFYQPPIWLRIILFIATVLGILALFGLFALAGADSENAIQIMMLVFGLGCFVLLETLIRGSFHYKSGVSEALMFTGSTMLLFGLVGFGNSEGIYFLFVVFFGALLTVRYNNLLGGLITLGGMGALLFWFVFEIASSAQAFLPFIFLFFFIGVFYVLHTFKNKVSWYFKAHIPILETALLVLIYLSVNYYVVRELSSELMRLRIQPGEDIPFAFLFYGFTVLIPLGYFAFGVLRKKITYIRVGILLLFASVITFKIYYSTGHPEISLTLAGILITSLTIWILNRLKTPINGFTREQLLTQDGLNAHTESILISTTMGGNEPQSSVSDSSEFGGGDFGGGGAGSSY